MTSITIPAQTIPAQSLAATVTVKAETVPAQTVALPNSGVSVGTYGDGSYIPRITVNAQGIVTAASSVPIPSSGGGSGLFKPTTAAQLQAAWQAAIANGYVLVLDPTTSILDATPIVLTGVDYGQSPRGLDGNGAMFDYAGVGAAVTLNAGPVNTNRGMVLKNFHLAGDYTSATTTGLHINATSGAAIYKFTLSDFYADGFGTGLLIEGNFFESLLDNLQIENCKGDGCVIGDGSGGVISNVTVRTPNLSRNGGWGLHLTTAKSVDVVAGGSFINNVAGGIWAESGMRRIDGPNLENCGTVGILLGAAGDDGCKVTGCSGSNTATLPGGPMTHLIKYLGSAGGLLQSGNTQYPDGAVLAP